MSLKIDELVAGRRYVFCTRDWESPTGEVIPGEQKERVFLCAVKVAPVGVPPLSFVKVLKEHCYEHLIAVKEIEAVHAVAEASV